ncbi:MAG: NAD(P)/FAD-dependent oxidoreductase [Solirubrobacterales bacterium]|nr:NAD(P)/FAD-dependent oxidoreductase [Solirubrobacterales bacterium]
MSGGSGSDRFDAIVLGAGPGGEVVTSRLAAQGLRTALVERELIGGECSYWACIPSKTLLRPGEVRSEAERGFGTATPELGWSEVAKYRDYMIRGLDDSSEVKSYEESGVSVFKGEGALAGPGAVRVGERRLETERVIVATGSDPVIPPIDGLARAGYWTNREATTFSEPPESVIILGGGPVGIELAQLMHRFGAEVHLIEAAERLLAREDERVGELVLEALRDEGIDVRLGAEASSVSAGDGRRTVHAAGEPVSARELVVAVGRRPRTEALGLDTVGIEPGPHGIEVDERCRAGERIWAIGDVTGVMAFTHVAKYQGRLVCWDIAGESVRADYGAVPRVVFSDPEVAVVGMSEAQAREAGVELARQHIVLGEAIARPYTYERDPRGEMQLLADRRRSVLVGAWGVGPLASEWIHFAALAIKAQIPVAVLKDTVPQFPTYAEAYQYALEALEL